MRLTYLTWSAFHVRTDTGLSILFDPWVAGDGAGVPASPVSVEDLGTIDYVVVSHTTFDHFGQTAEILKSSESAVLLCAKDVALHAASLGISPDRIIHFSPGNSLTVDGVWIKAVLAHHVSMRPFPEDSYLSGVPFSYFVREPSGTTLFFGGDTSLHSEMKLFGDLYKPDIAILGVGGRRGGHPTRGTFGPVLPIDEAVHAANMLGVRYAVPSHYLADAGVDGDWPTAFAAAAPDIQALVMERGQMLEFDGGALSSR